MLKRAAPAAACLLALFAPAGASANSGPSYMENSPSFSMTPLEDCPVEVEGETLTFDFSAGLKSVSQYSPAAAVTAEYRMTNPTGKPLTVQMAFPLVASLADLSQMEGVRVTAGGKDVPFRIAPGGGVTDVHSQPAYYDSGGSILKSALPSFAAILQSVKDEKPVLKKLAGKGKLYRVAYNGVADVLASFQPPCDDLAVLATSANGFSQSSAGVQVEGYTHGDAPLETGVVNPPFSLLVFGAKSDPAITVRPEGNGTQASASASSGGGAGWKTQTGEEDAEAYLREMAERSSIYQKYPTEDLADRLTSVLLKNAEASLAGGNKIFSDASVYDFYSQARVIVLAYEVAFPAGGAVDVAVTYPMGGTMDSRSTAQPLYTYGYLLNPAKGWASFRDLSIRVVPSKQEPYVVRSSIPLAKGGDGSYTASLASLPENDLVFSLYPSEKTEPKGPAPWRPAGYVVFLFIVLLAVVLCAAGIHRPGRIGRGPMP